MMAAKSEEMQEPSVPLHESHLCWEKNLMGVVETKFGQGIEVVDSENVREQLQKFVDDMVFEIVSRNPEPVMKQPRVDVVAKKELVNSGDVERQETVDILAMRKTGNIHYITYQFQTKEGVSFDQKDNLGDQINRLAKVGGETRVGEKWSDMYSSVSTKEESQVTVHPKSKITIEITLTTKQSEQDFTLKFKISKSRSIHVKCRKGWGRFFSKSTEGDVFAEEILQSLPNFEMDDDNCFFTLSGTLSVIEKLYITGMTQSGLTESETLSGTATGPEPS